MSDLEALAAQVRSLANEAHQAASFAARQQRDVSNLAQRVASAASGSNDGSLRSVLALVETAARALGQCASQLETTAQRGGTYAAQLANGAQGGRGNAGSETVAKGGLKALLGRLAVAGRSGQALSDLPDVYSAISEAIEAASDALRRWTDADQENVVRWFGGADDHVRTTLLDRLQRADSALREVVVLPFEPGQGGPNDFAYVYPSDTGRRVFVGDLFWGSHAKSPPPDSQAGVILHELSHFHDVGGTADVEYGYAAALDLAESSASSALDNADNFEYFLEGFM